MTYPDLNPVAIELGPIAIHWYGLMYVLGIAFAWWLLARRMRRPDVHWNADQLADLAFHVVLGLIVGARLGYILFYDFATFAEEPGRILRVWEGGMSFHGGLAGVLAAVGVYAWRNKRHYFDITDFIGPVVPIGLGLGRIGNFINSELWGKPTDAPWGMVVDGVSRHPSQLYQSFLEGLVMFVVLFWLTTRPRPRMLVTGLFMIMYGSFRFLVEFVRLPDAHIGYLAWDWLTMGQVLSVPMILFGLVLLYLVWRNPVYPEAPESQDSEKK